jgi:hypothetical protein
MHAGQDGLEMAGVEIAIDNSQQFALVGHDVCLQEFIPDGPGS